MKKAQIILLSLFIFFLNWNNVLGKNEKLSKQFQLQSKETNAPNFVRLLVMRLIFGIASSMGLGDRLSGFLGGVFVPPGADDYDDYDLFDGDDIDL
ncbi:hypothetical protein HCN44_000555 [Aphidius gifuensis]|uniref:Uncharacterized protein n=1 Tax=Aphidius gifuensis TaxID=684658 RepID=A0A834XP45_APHGI|nr:uncharacterized protein LOC122854741 [Aphidius gifuensis]KAF7990750.1 hypothetical protein HCN44_000555 [Aphidius gifuensis]